MLEQESPESFNANTVQHQQSLKNVNGDIMISDVNSNSDESGNSKTIRIITNKIGKAHKRMRWSLFRVHLKLPPQQPLKCLL